jgi:hypothetical protein
VAADYLEQQLAFETREVNGTIAVCPPDAG